MITGFPSNIHQLGVVCMCYAIFSKQLSVFMNNINIHVLLRLLVIAGFQYGLAGLGITLMCIFIKA